MSKKYPESEWITDEEALALREGEIIVMVYEDEIFWAVQRTPDLDRPFWKGKRLGWYMTEEIEPQDAFALRTYDRLFDSRSTLVTYTGESLYDPRDRESYSTTADFSNARSGFVDRLRRLVPGTAIFALEGTPKRLLLGVKRYDGDWSILNEQRWISDEEALEIGLLSRKDESASPAAQIPPIDSYPTN